jgi:PKD repeat protein
MKVIFLALLLSFSAAAAYALSGCTQPSPSNTIITYTGLPSNCTASAATPCTTSDTIFFSAVAIGYSFGCESHNYFWDFGDTTTGSGQSVMHTFASPGTYLVKLNLTSPFTSTTLTRTVTVFTVVPMIDRRALLLLALAMAAVGFLRLR